MKQKIKNLLENLDLINFLEDKDIDYQSVGKNIGNGWIGIETCPFCGATNQHFGINIQTKSINCWVCHTKGTILKFLMKTEEVSLQEAINMIKEYVNGYEKEEVKDIDIEKEVKKVFQPEPLPELEIKEEFVKEIIPPGDLITENMLANRPKLYRFLNSRGIDSEICKKFDLRYEYQRSLRLIIPVKSPNGTVFAYQGRDVTGKAMLKYITQPKGINIKSTLFNYRKWIKEESEIAIIVEGPLDVIRLDSLINKYLPDLDSRLCPLACFSNNISDEQIMLLKNARKIIIMFDRDSWFNYKKLEELSVDLEPVILPSGKDPGSLSSKEFLDLQLSNFL